MSNHKKTIRPQLLAALFAVRKRPQQKSYYSVVNAHWPHIISVGRSFSGRIGRGTSAWSAWFWGSKGGCRRIRVPALFAMGTQKTDDTDAVSVSSMICTWLEDVTRSTNSSMTMTRLQMRQ
jgi:hypothetical protein